MPLFSEFLFALHLTWCLNLYCSSTESTARSTILWITVSNIGAILHVPWAYYYKAGFTFDKMLHNMPDDAFDIIQKIHVRAPFRLIRQAAPYFRVKVLVILFLIQIVTSTYRVKTARTAPLSMYHPPQASMEMSVKPTMPLLNHPSSVLPKPLLKNGVPSVSVPTPSLSVSSTLAWQLRKKLEKRLISMGKRLHWAFRVLRDLFWMLRNRTQMHIPWFLSGEVDRRMKLLLPFFCECRLELEGFCWFNFIQPRFSSCIVYLRAHTRSHRRGRDLNYMS